MACVVFTGFGVGVTGLLILWLLGVFKHPGHEPEG